MLRALYALPRTPFKDKTRTLDLAYITPQLIVTSMPTENKWRSYYRTPLKELMGYLDAAHSEHWHIFNLQEEGEYDYDFASTNHRVFHSPTKDHTPPKLKDLAVLIANVKEFLEVSASNVAVIHCKAGQGRSGVLACAVLMIYYRQTLCQSLETFRSTRMRPLFGGGVAIPSQIRYLRYVDRARSDLSRLETPANVLIQSIKINNPRYTDLQVSLESLMNTERQNGLLWTTELSLKDEGSTLVCTPTCDTYFSDENVHIKVSRAYGFQGFSLVHGSGSIWFNACMEVERDPDLKTPESHLSGRTPNSSSLGRFQAPWTQVDGVTGFGVKGTTLFDSVEVSWCFA